TFVVQQHCHFIPNCLQPNDSVLTRRVKHRTYHRWRKIRPQGLSGCQRGSQDLDIRLFASEVGLQELGRANVGHDASVGLVPATNTFRQPFQIFFAKLLPQPPGVLSIQYNVYHVLEFSNLLAELIEVQVSSVAQTKLRCEAAQLLNQSLDL